ncbi:MAG: SLC13 family permease [Caldilineaceae bacterium]
MTLAIGVVYALLFGALLIFAWDRYPIDFVALGILAVMLMLGPWLGLQLAEIISGFSNPATITVMAMFILSGAITRTGMINWLAGRLTAWGGRNELRQLAVMLLVVGAVSAFLNNTATVAILMPMVIGMARAYKRSPSKLLMPLSYGAQLGGVVTLIGTSTNVLASALAAERGYGAFSMFEFSAIGLLIFATGLLYFLTIGHRLLPERRGADDALASYRIHEYLAEVAILPTSPLVGKTLAESRLQRQLDIQVIDIVRGEEHLGFLPADHVLEAGDILLVEATQSQLRRLQENKGLSLAPQSSSELATHTQPGLDLLEVVLAPNSDLIGGTLTSTNFRNHYNCSVVAMRKHGQLVHERLNNVFMEFGDALLLSGSPYAFAQIKREPAFIVTEQAPLEIFRYEKIPTALTIIIAVVVIAGFGVPILVTSMVGSVLMVLTGCLQVNELHEAIRWDVIFLLAGVLPLGLALEKTGGAQLLADFAANHAGTLSPLLVLILFYAVAMLMTEFISNNATVVILAPVAATTATALGLNPRAFILAVMFAASTSFMTPVGYQTNTMIYGPGGYKFLDFLRVGAILNLILAVATPLYIYLLWGI